jgi:lactoylglutathione lyase
MYLDHVGLSVRDLDAQRAWYSLAFGFTESTPFEIAPLGLRGTFMVGENGIAIELLERRGSVAGIQGQDSAEALLTQGYGHLCFRVEDVDGVHAMALAAGASEQMSPRQSPERGVRMSFIADPEGNLIELLDRPDAVGARAS